MMKFSSLMRNVLATGAVLCLGVVAQANSLIPSFKGITLNANNTWRWHYSVDLSAPSTVKDTNDFLTMYDFVGITGAGTEGANAALWSTSIQALGKNAVNQSVPDQAGVNNAVFTYAGAPVPQPGPQTPIFSFYIDSKKGLSGAGAVYYAGQDHNTSLNSLEGNSGQVLGAVPEPAFFQLSALLGLGGLSLLKLRKKRN